MTGQRDVACAADGLPRRPDAGSGGTGEESGPLAECADELSPWFADLDDAADAPESGPFAGEDDELPEGIVELDDEPDDAPVAEPVAHRSPGVPPARRPGRRLVKPEWRESHTFSPAERVLVLDIWQRSGLAATDVASLIQISPNTLRMWRRKFDQLGPEGLIDAPRGGKRGSRLPEATKRAILMIKETNPEFGTERISDMLKRGQALAASPGAVARVLKEAGYVTEDVRVPQHRDRPRTFERAKPNQLWQTDLFTFTMKRTNRRVYLVAFMDDHSRYITSFALHASASTRMVIEALGEGIASYGSPAEVLTDNGPQYVTWRGKSAFAKECLRRGIEQIVSRPRHPQTLGKIERFWQTLWRECLEPALLADLGEARSRIGHFVDYYNFQRPSRSLGGLVPADRFFEAAPEVRRTIEARVAANALELARNGEPKAPFYLTGNVGGKTFSVHAEGERILMRHGEGEVREIELTTPEPMPVEPAASASKPADASVDVPDEEKPPAEEAPVEKPHDEDDGLALPAGYVSENVRRIVQSLREADRE